MKKPEIFSNLNFPSTRFLGSKVKLLRWIHKNIRDLDFNSVLDAFGGTGSFSYLMKTMGKKVYYNDILSFNQIIGIAIIENNNEIVSNSLVRSIMKRKSGKNYKDVIQKNFRGIYFKDHENKWLDVAIQNILEIKNKYQRSILLSSLFQACLIKRPFNLFHRNNLKLRTNNVTRSFGNKTTWETSFRKHFLKFIQEYNGAVFDNGKRNVVLGGYEVLKVPKKKYDLVYLDPPYLSKKSKINYLDCYHFLEGLSGYLNWESKIDKDSKNKKFKRSLQMESWLDREKITELFYKMIFKFKDSIIVFSYRDNGIPSIKKISDIFLEITGKRPLIRYKNYKYALSNGSTREVLFILRK